MRLWGLCCLLAGIRIRNNHPVSSLARQNQWLGSADVQNPWLDLYSGFRGTSERRTRSANISALLARRPACLLHPNQIPLSSSVAFSCDPSQERPQGPPGKHPLMLGEAECPPWALSFPQEKLWTMVGVLHAELWWPVEEVMWSEHSHSSYPLLWSFSDSVVQQVTSSTPSWSRIFQMKSCPWLAFKH